MTASQHIKWLREELTRLEAERNRIDEDIKAYHRVLARTERAEGIGQPVSAAKAVVNEMWRILEEEGQQLHYKQIYQRLIDRGIQVPGRDPLKNVGAHLSADKRFISDGAGHWRLASWPPPPESLAHHRSLVDQVAVFRDSVARAEEEVRRPDEFRSRVAEEVSRKYQLSPAASEDLRAAVLRQDKYEVQRIARLLEPGLQLAFFADLAPAIEVLEGQRPA